MKFNKYTFDIISKVDTIDWSDISELRIYGDTTHEQYILEYILLTEKDCKRFAECYPSLPEKFQIMEVIESSVSSAYGGLNVAGGMSVYSYSGVFLRRLIYAKCIAKGSSVNRLMYNNL